MKNSNTFSLKASIAEKRIASLMATGRFVDSGAVYTAEQAIKDASNPALRMTATIDGSKLSWGK